MAARDLHLLEHPVFVEAGGGIHLGTTEGAANERPAAFALEVGEAFVQRGVTELGPRMEAGEAVSDLD